MCRLLLCILTLVTITWGLQNCKMSQRLVMKKQWASAFNSMKNKSVSLGETVWLRLFDDHPDIEDFYIETTNNSHSYDEFQRFAKKVMEGFDLCVSCIDDGNVLYHQLEHMKKFHKGKSIPSSYFDILLHTMMDLISEINKSPVDEEAWHDCGTFIMLGMQDSGDELS